MSTETETLTQDFIDHYPGGDTLYHHSLFRSFEYTEGVCEMAIRGGAHWLLDLLAGAHGRPSIKDNPRLQEFQLWELKLRENDRGAILTCREDTGVEPAYMKAIPFTDFPLPYLKLYRSGGVMLLPSEY